MKFFSFFYITFVFLYSFNGYSATLNNYVIPEGIDKISQAPLKGIGTVEKIISTEDTGWFELFIHSAPWPTDIFVDDKFVGHFSFADKAWMSVKRYKALNLFLHKGVHKIRLERLYHPGLPYIHSIKIMPADGLSGNIIIEFDKVEMVHRFGDKFVMHFLAKKQLNSYEIVFDIKNAFTGEVVDTLNKVIPAGIGLFEGDIEMHTMHKGVFNVKTKHHYYGQLARPFQYVVIDASNSVINGTNIEKELITRIVPAETEPDYTSPHYRVRKGDNDISPFIESAGNGVYGTKNNPDYFAYELDLPDSSGFYLAEIDYPDNEARAFTISLVEKTVNPHALDAGIVTGGNYPISNKTQTTQIYFHTREHDPRLLFLNWHQGKKIAVNEIRIYRVNEDGLPPLIEAAKSERKFSAFYEEPMRFTNYFGARATGNDWTQIYTTAERWARWSAFVGQNQWLQSIANYQHTMWPTDLLPGYAPADEDAFSLLGPVSPYDPLKKDVVKLLLLMAEKYGISFIGELVMPASGYIKEALDNKFSQVEVGSYGNTYKPWLIVSNEGVVGGESVFAPYFNPVHPEVQKWVTDIFSELALRYRDSPNFDGLAIRLMGWAFASWQAFPSINWGYGDYTIEKFERDTGIKIPVHGKLPGRFKERYQWLAKNYYETWINWRVSAITAYHKKLYGILKTARPDLKLYINTFGPDFSQADWGKHGGWQGRYRKLNKIGWHKMLRESGVEPKNYTNEPGIVFSNSFQTPAGVRAQLKVKGKAAEQYAGLQWQEANNPTSIKLSNKNKHGGTVAAVRFTNEYMEYDFPVSWIGYESIQWRKKKKLRIVGRLEPTGRSVLQRYAWAMSEGNIGLISDGGLGYVLGEPSILRPFMREYHSLPNIGMTKRVMNNDSVLWYGKKDKEYYMYLVNISGHAITSKVCFPKKTYFTRVTSGIPIKTNIQNQVNISLNSYELAVFKTTVLPVVPELCH